MVENINPEEIMDNYFKKYNKNISLRDTIDILTKNSELSDKLMVLMKEYGFPTFYDAIRSKKAQMDNIIIKHEKELN